MSIPMLRAPWNAHNGPAGPFAPYLPVARGSATNANRHERGRGRARCLALHRTRMIRSYPIRIPYDVVPAAKRRRPGRSSADDEDDR